MTWRNRGKNTYLRFHVNKITDLELLDNVSDKEIIITGLNQQYFEVFCSKYADKFDIVQLIHCNLIKDLSPLESLKNVRYIIIDWNNKATKLWDMLNNTSLKGLFLDDVMKLTSIVGIETAPCLTEFTIEQDCDSKLFLETLEPLSKCDFIESLNIRIEGVLDKSALPITKMKLLKNVGLSTRLFETEQFAMLSAYLSGVALSPNAPYLIFDNDDVRNVLVVGKNKTWLSKNSPKLKQYELEWNEFKKRYSLIN